MSRAFVKEDASQEAVVVNARAALPDGERNLVTPLGLTLLQEEHAELLAEQKRVQDESGDQRRLAEIELVMEELVDRLRSAVLVDPAASDPDEVGFGHTVVLLTRSGPGAGRTRRLSLVGVDEADPAAGKVAFTSPIAQLLLGKRIGDVVTHSQREGLRIMEVVTIE